LENRGTAGVPKTPRRSGQRPIALHLFGEGGLKFYRLLKRKPKYVPAAKTSHLAERSWFEIASQSAIFVGPVGAMLLGSGSRWGFVVGLATQPFWFYTSFRHRQWGIFVASIFYACGWAMGVYRNF
jgi:hypothetical protein